MPHTIFKAVLNAGVKGQYAVAVISKTEGASDNFPPKVKIRLI